MDFQFKINTPSGELRRLRFKSQPAWEEFVRSLRAFVSGRNIDEFLIQYRDEEGDLISVHSQAEWSEALHILSADKIKRFSIVTKNPKSSSSSIKPIEDALRGYVDQFMTSADSIVHQIPSLVETIMEEVKNIQTPSPATPQLVPVPFQEESPRFTPNVRSSLLGEVRGPQCWRLSSRTGNNNNGQPRPFERRFRRPFPRSCETGRLHCLGLRLLGEKNFDGALECYQHLVRISPADGIARYNLACTYSLISSTKEDPVERENNQALAVASLRQAISLGYSNFFHIEHDSDLDPIREFDQYKELIAQVKTPEPEPQLVDAVTPQVNLEEPIVPVPIPVAAEPVVNNEVLVQEEEQPQPQEQPKQPEEEVLESSVRFAEELKQLNDMGFFDSKKNLELLETFQGDIFRAVSQLLDY